MVVTSGCLGTSASVVARLPVPTATRAYARQDEYTCTMQVRFKQ